MRTIVLSPDHSSWWLLSPGVSLYFDRLQILKADYEKLLSESKNTSYHEAVASRLQQLVQEGIPEIEVIESAPGVLAKDELEDISQALLDEILKAAANPNDEMIDSEGLLKLTADAYRDWMNHSKRKTFVLREDEPYRIELEQDLIPAWTDRREEIMKLAEANPEEIVGRYKENQQALKTLRHLLGSAWQCISMTDAGMHIHDPMLIEYMPVVDLLERLRSAPPPNESVNFSTMFAAYHFRMSRYGSIAPLKLSFRDLPRIVEKYTSIRRALERVDEALQEISTEDPASAFELAKREIAPLVREAKSAAKRVEWGYWAVGLFSPLVAIAGNPFLVSKTEKAASALVLAKRNVGEFAGIYALFADGLVVSQREFQMRKAAASTYTALKSTFWDSGD